MRCPTAPGLAPGGESLTKSELGFASTADPQFHAEIEPAGGYVLKYDVRFQYSPQTWHSTEARLVI